MYRTVEVCNHRRVTAFNFIKYQCVIFFRSAFSLSFCAFSTNCLSFFLLDYLLKETFVTHYIPNDLLILFMCVTGEALKYDKNFTGPLSKRSCTDVLCLLIFIVFLGCWGFVGFYGEFQKEKLFILFVPQN